jgi:hypothetical protein
MREGALMALPPHAVEWMNRAEIDYIGPFVKSWAAFNAWFRHASGSRRDADGLRFVKQSPNAVRNAIMPLLRPLQRDGHGGIVPDLEPAQKFKLLIRDLHVCLDNFHIEVVRDEIVERISFRSICIGRGANLPQTSEYYGMRYIVEKANGQWRSIVRSNVNHLDIRATIDQDKFDLDGLQGHAQFGQLSLNQRANLLALYQRCNPRPMTDLFAGRGDGILAGDVEFKCSDQQLFEALIEVIYSLRNTLLHGELQPHEQAFAAYEPAYRIVIKFLGCAR